MARAKSQTQTHVDTSLLRKSRGRAGGYRTPEPSSFQLAEPSGPSFGQYSRVVAAVRRAASLLEADQRKELPQVAVNALERAVKTFLQDVRLGLPQGGGTTSNQGSFTTPGRYGRKMQTEVQDPERAARIRKNRAVWKDEEHSRMVSRKGGR